MWLWEQIRTHSSHFWPVEWWFLDCNASDVIGPGGDLGAVCIEGFHTILFVIQPGLRTTELSFLKKKNVWQAITLPSKSQMNAILRHSCSAPFRVSAQILLNAWISRREGGSWPLLPLLPKCEAKANWRNAAWILAHQGLYHCPFGMYTMEYYSAIKSNAVEGLF